jgi:hypothetical protein
MAKGFDCSDKLTAQDAKALKTAGFDYVARYLGNNWKSFDAAEAKLIQNAGLKLISIFEKSPLRASYFTRAQGIADAKEADVYAKTVGQPLDTAIYFTVDYDAQASDMPAILAYINGIKETLLDYRIGLYGSYDVMQAVKGKIDYYWQTYAWSGGRVASFIHMYQYENEVTVSGVSIDRDEIKAAPGDWKNIPPKPAVQDVRSRPVWWDGGELKKGQIGRLRILKRINLWKRIGNKLQMVRILQPGEVYRVYGYDNRHGGQYNVGAGLWVTKMKGYVKYETPSKKKLAQVNQ